MGHELILFRHGKAEPRREELRDTDRALTEKGMKELKDIVPKLASLIKPGRKLLIWSSHKLRAKQTAQILADGLGTGGFRCFAWIGSGDLSALTAELEHIKQPLALILVGHEPYLSEWGGFICGRSVPMKKGSAACFELADGNRLQGTLKWLCSKNSLVIY